MHEQLDLINYPIWHEPLMAKLWFKLFIFFAIIGSLAVLLTIFIYYRKKKKKLYWQIALAKLEKLRKEIEQGISRKELYRFLLNIIKNYIVDRYKVDIISKTEEEMVGLAAQWNEIGQHASVLQVIFKQACQAKYTDNDQLSAEQDEQAIVLMMEFIRTTRPQK